MNRPLLLFLGMLWLCSLVVFLFLGSVTYAGEEPALRGWICATCGVL